MARQALLYLADLTSETSALDAPAYFQVTTIRGIFRSMQADHWFRTLPSGATQMRDDFRVAAPLPLLGPLEVLFLRRYMLALLRERNAVIKQVAESDESARIHLGRSRHCYTHLGFGCPRSLAVGNRGLHLRRVHQL